MHSAISDAHAVTSRPNQLVLPWEQPCVSWIFDDGADANSIVPDAPKVLDYVEPSPPDVGQRS